MGWYHRRSSFTQYGLCLLSIIGIFALVMGVLLVEWVAAIFYCIVGVGMLAGLAYIVYDSLKGLK